MTETNELLKLAEELRTAQMRLSRKTNLAVEGITEPEHLNNLRLARVLRERGYSAKTDESVATVFMNGMQLESQLAWADPLVIPWTKKQTLKKPSQPTEWEEACSATAITEGIKEFDTDRIAMLLVLLTPILKV